MAAFALNAKPVDAAGPLSYAVLRIAFGLILPMHGLPKVLGGGHGSLGDPLASHGLRAARD